MLSAEVRYYSMAAFLFNLSLLNYVKFLDDPDNKKRRAWLAASLTLGLYTHYFLLMAPAILIAHGFWLRTSGNLSLKKSLAAPMRSLLYFSPWILATSVQVHRMSYRFRDMMSPIEILWSWGCHFTMAGYDNFAPWMGDIWTGDASPKLLAALCGFCLLFLIGISMDIASKRMESKLLAIGFAIPAVAIFTLSLWLPIFGHRYLSPWIGLFMIAIASAIVKSRWIILQSILSVVVLATMLFGVVSAFDASQINRENWPGEAAYVKSIEKPGDGLLVYNRIAAEPFLFYYKGKSPVLPALTSDPLTFAQDDAVSIRTRLDLYFKEHPRLFFLRHYGHMYEREGVIDDYMNKNAVCFQDRADSKSAFKPIRLCCRDVKTAIAAAGGPLARVIDFRQKNFKPMQVIGIDISGNDPWRWMGKSARFILPRNADSKRLTARIMVFPKYFQKGETVVALLADGKIIDRKIIDTEGESTLSGELPADSQHNYIEGALWSESTFDPANFFKGSDHAPKSVLVGSIGISD